MIKLSEEASVTGLGPLPPHTGSEDRPTEEEEEEEQDDEEQEEEEEEDRDGGRRPLGESSCCTQSPL